MTVAGSGARFALCVHHTHADREWAYDRTSSVGPLDTASVRRSPKAGRWQT